MTSFHLSKTHNFYFFPFLLILLSLKALLILLFIQTELIGLGPDEAQYWTWSQSLDWGYYSKPPGIAWQIWLGTKLFGNTELGVRFVSVWLNFALSLSIFALARTCSLTQQTAFWAALCFAISPLGLIGSFLATTDGGLTLFWTLSCLILVQGLVLNTSPNYLLLGITVLGGAFFKWPIYYLWIFVLGGAVWIPSWRKKSLILGILISLLGLLPSLLWNYTHDWATFRHIFATIQGESSRETLSKAKSNFWEFLGAQALLVSPIFFILIFKSFFTSLKKRFEIPIGVFFCSVISLITLIIFSLLACFQKIQGNWCAFIYPAAFIVLAWNFCENYQQKKWLWNGLLFSLLLSFAGITLPLLEVTPYTMNPFRHNLGWKTLQKELKGMGYDPNHYFLFGDKYQTASILSFYGPEQKRAYFFNLQGSRKNQFSYWPSPEKGENSFFVVTENAPHLKTLENGPSYLEQLSPYFEQVEYLGVKPLIIQKGKIAKVALIYKGIGYNGTLPKEPEKY